MKISKDKLKDIIREELASLKENNALDNAIANRDANRANRDSKERYEDLYFGLQKLISKVSKNNKVKGYGGELTHAFVDLLYDDIKTWDKPMSVSEVDVIHRVEEHLSYMVSRSLSDTHIGTNHD